MASTNHKYLFIFLSLAIACLIIIILVILPTINKIKNNNITLAREKKQISNLLRQGQNVAENRKNFRKIKANLDELNNLWLRTGNELKFITDLEKIAKQNKLKQNINFNNKQVNTKNKNKTKIIPIDITIKGQLADIMNYINQLEILDYYINFTQINFAKEAEKLKNYSNQIKIGENSSVDIPQHKSDLKVKLNGLTYWK